MESHTDTATVEAPVAEASEAVESLPQETTQDSFLDALDAALSNISENPVSGDIEETELQPETEGTDEPPLADKAESTEEVTEESTEEVT